MLRRFLLAGLVLFAVVAAVFVADNSWVTTRFDADLWRAQQYSTAIDNPRAAMVVDLEENHLRKGMSRADVVTLLGGPDGGTEVRYVYDLGASSYGVDLEYLTIEFDANDQVTGFYLLRS